MEKRGLSTIITQILLILLVLVAVGFLMTVIRSTIVESGDSVTGNFELLNIDLDIMGVVDNGDTLDVRIKRNTGGGDLRSLKFEISDGTNSEVIEEIGITLEELDQATYTLDYPGLVKEISVSPVTRVESGKEQTGNVADTMTFTSKQVIQNLGGVSWYKMDGNARDELGFAPGTIVGGVDCDVSGQYGNACQFDGASSITTGKDRSDFFDVDEGTMMAWVRQTGVASQENVVFDLPSIIKQNDNNLGVYIGISPLGGNDRVWSYNLDIGFAGAEIDASYTNNIWTHIAWVHTGGNLYSYGEGVQSTPVLSEDSLTSDILEIGEDFTGEIDELMIFDRGLNADEVDDLANLDLS